DVVDDFLKGIAVLHSLGTALKARVGGHVAALQYLLAKAGPFALILDRQVHGFTIAGNERTIWCNRSVLGPCAWWLRSTIGGVVRGITHPLTQGLQHGNFHGRAFAGPVAQQQRRKDAGIGIHGSSRVGDGDAYFGWSLFGAGHRNQPRLALDQQIVGFLVAVGAGAAVAG